MFSNKGGEGDHTNTSTSTSTRDGCGLAEVDQKATPPHARSYLAPSLRIRNQPLQVEAAIGKYQGRRLR